MQREGTNGDRFLNAFRDIEEELRRQDPTSQRNPRKDFKDLVDDSRELIAPQKVVLMKYARLRNAIVHSPHRNDRPIADPRLDVVEDIEKLRDLVLKPPTLEEALAGRGRPRLFSPRQTLAEFLELVTESDFSQAPVDRGNGKYDLITTNAVARWYARQMKEHGGIVDDAAIEDVLAFAEVGDRLEKVGKGTSAAHAINVFSGEVATATEPPAALLVMGLPGQPPQRLCVRADLGRLYAQLAR